jgi:hypothetical protein
MQELPIPVAARSKAWVAAARLLGLRARIPPGVWMSVSCECCVLSGRGVCIGMITPPEESYRVLCECDREALIMRRPCPSHSGLLRHWGGGGGGSFGHLTSTANFCNFLCWYTLFCYILAPGEAQRAHGRTLLMRLLPYSLYIFSSWVLILSALLTKHCSSDEIKRNEMSGACGTYERQERCIQGMDGWNLKERGYLEDLDLDMMIMLKWNFIKLDVGT